MPVVVKPLHQDPLPVRLKIQLYLHSRVRSQPALIYMQLTAPHAMAKAPSAIDRMSEMMAKGMAAVLNGERPPRVVVNPSALDRTRG